MPQTFTSFADLKRHIDRETNLADVAAAEKLARSARLRAANGRKPGSGPAVAR